MLPHSKGLGIAGILYLEGRELLHFEPVTSVLVSLSSGVGTKIS